MADTRQHAVRRGDQLYYTGPAGVSIGQVVCWGKDGATLEDTGRRTPVRWEHVLGHKERASFSARVVDQGEDGMVVEDDRGERSFLAGALPESESESEPQEPNALYDQTLVERKPQKGWDVMLGKAMPVLFFLKGGAPLQNRPGLALQTTTDRAGHSVHRWKRTSEEQKQGRPRGQPGDVHEPAAPGHQVAFHHQGTGERVSGKVVASGEHGVTVHDNEGGEHHVKHGDYQPHEEASQQAKPQRSAQRQEGESLEDFKARNTSERGRRRIVGGTTGKAYNSPIQASDLEGVSGNAAQPIENTIEALYKSAREALGQYQEWADQVAQSLSAGVVDINKGDKLDLNKEGMTFIIGPVKGEKRVKEKAEEEAVETGAKEADYQSIKDVVRGTVAVDSLDQIAEVWDALKQTGIKLARKPKDRYQGKGFACEYRDIMMNIEMPNGHIAELQINVKTMLAAKEEAHALYEEHRTIKAQASAAHGKYEQWPDAIKSRFEVLERQQITRYRKAWADITQGKSSKMLQKCDTVYLWWWD